MSPVSDKASVERMISSKEIKKFLETDAVTEDTLYHLSVIKGMFTRVFKQDQWDWFLTFESLGRVGRKKSIRLSNYIRFIRSEIKKENLKPLAFITLETERI